MDKSKGGRPAHHDGEVKKAAIAVRTAPSIRDALREASEESGRSVTQEVEARLVASFDRDGGKRSPETQQLLNRIGAEISETESLTGKAWHRNRKTAGAVLEMFNRRPMSWIRVDDPFDDGLVSAAWQKLYGLRQDRDRNQQALQELGLMPARLNAFTPTGSQPGLFANTVPTGVALGGLLKATEGRWRERALLEKFEAPEQVKKAAELVIDHLERLDKQIFEAEGAYDEASRPFHEAEKEGRQVYLAFRQRLAQDQWSRGEIPDVSDISLIKP